MHRMWILLAATALLSACAGNTFKGLSRRIPSLPLAQSRIYFYRTATNDAALQPPVNLDGAPVGIALAASFFFVDREPGQYQVVLGDDAEHKLTMKAGAGQTLYVRFDVRSALLADYLAPVDVPEVDAAREILKMDYTGPALPRIKHPRQFD